MSKEENIKRVADFLIETIQAKVIRDLAEKNLMDIRKTNSANKNITKTDIDSYIEANFVTLKNTANKSIQETAAKLVKESSCITVLKDLGILSLILVPPMYPIAQFLIKSLKDANDSYICDTSSCIVSLLLLSYPIVSYIMKLFSGLHISFKKDN